MTVENASTQALGYVARHWRGRFPLGISFWRNGLTTLVAMLLAGRLWRFAYEHWVRNATLGYVILTVTMLSALLFFCVRVWSDVGVWRSAAQHRARGGRAAWAWVARGVLVLLASYDLITVVALTAAPVYAITEAARGRGPRMASLSLKLSADGSTLWLAGDLGAGARMQLERALDAAPHVSSIHLRSYGGGEFEGIDAAKVIHARHLDTFVDDYCYSACTTMFVAGRQRSVGPRGTLKFHKPLMGEAHVLDYGMRDMLAGLQAVGASDALLTRFRNLHDREIWQPTRAELTQYGLITATDRAAP